MDVIPGVSSGIAVSALTKVPLTHRGIASSVAFISGHSDAVQIPQTDTLVYYMGGSNIRLIAQKAIAQGKNPKTPVMLAHNVSLPGQQVFNCFRRNRLISFDQRTPGLKNLHLKGVEIIVEFLCRVFIFWAVARTQLHKIKIIWPEKPFEWTFRGAILPIW